MQVGNIKNKSLVFYLCKYGLRIYYFMDQSALKKVFAH